MVTVDLTYDLPDRADVVVIGGGILGAATAFFAERAGLRTVVLERRPLLCSLTTPAATGAFRLQFDNAEEIELVRESVTFFEQFADATGIPDYDIDLHQHGYLWLTRSASGIDRQRVLVEQQQGWGLTDVELLSGDEAVYRFPYLVREGIVSARFRARDGWLDVKKATNGLAAASGATFVVNCEVTGILQQDDRVQGVITSKGNIRCDTVVNAAGPFAGVVAQMAGVILPLAPRIRQKLVMPFVPDVPATAPMTINEDTGSHWRPAMQGAYLLYTVHDSPVTPPLDNVPTDHAFYWNLLNPASPVSVAHLSPFWGDVWRRNDSHWFLMAGQYTYTPDHRPLLGPSALAGLFLNVGYSGHGIMGSIGGSRRVVDTITGKLTPEANPFRPDREMEERLQDVL